jgi:hypothetical protein
VGIKEADCLLLAVFHDLEVVLAEVGDGFVVLVGNDDVDQNGADVHFESGGFGLWLRSGLGRERAGAYG